MDCLAGCLDESFAITGGSAFTNSRRPSVAVSVVICALAGRGAPNTPLSTNESTRTLLRFRGICRSFLRLGEGIGRKTRCAELVDSDRAMSRRLLHLRSSGLLTSIAKCCTCEATLLTLPAIIAGLPAGQGHSARHFLAPMCLFRQPRPNPAFRPLNRPPAWPAPVSACQHGL